MAQNLFEKYGIKEVADVTLFRIERKNETYESQRKISVSSILKGILTKDIVYPLEDGKGAADGFEAYIFKDANVLTHFNYDCDDIINAIGTSTIIDRNGEVVNGTAGLNFTGDVNDLLGSENIVLNSLVDVDFHQSVIDNLTQGYEIDNIVVTGINSLPSSTDAATYSGSVIAAFQYEEDEETKNGTVNVTFNEATLSSSLEAVIKSAGATLTKAQLEMLIDSASGTSIVVTTPENFDIETIVSDITVTQNTVAHDKVPTYEINFTAILNNAVEKNTGIYDISTDGPTHYEMDNDMAGAGTHEFTYAQQVCMIYSKNQNLITKAGTRYQFADADKLFAGFEFNDEFAAAPNSTERLVVVGLNGKVTENLYDLEEIDQALKEMTDKIEAKAYDITYSDYAELVVEDEMGFYMPQQLGYALDKKTNVVTFFDSTNPAKTYKAIASARRGIDLGIYNAVETWGDDKHYSINDAIDALKQESKLLDSSASMKNTGFSRVFGGYKVRGKALNITPVFDDLDDATEVYDEYLMNGVKLKDMINTTEDLSSKYNLEAVLNALATAKIDAQTGTLRIRNTNGGNESNRAIYIDPENGTFANRASIYLLKNVNANALNVDKEGIFEFYDKKGNKLYYQDKVFAGTGYLALVTIGTVGLVFVVNRHCTKTFTKTAWMINEGGYLTDKQAKKVVDNGLIHTVTVTEDDESFDATCTVSAIKVRKTKKNVLRYVPVLFLDTLKVSTLEQASESADATGGKGNAKLITWDYGKEITLSIEDALYTPASMAAIWAGKHGDLKNGVKDTSMIDRMEKITAKRNFIIPAGNQEGAPSEGNTVAQAVYYDPKTMEPFQDGTPIAEGEVIYKFTRSVAYDGNSIGNTIEVSAESFPGTYRVIGETLVRDKATGEDQRFQFIIPEAKMSAADTSITLEADGEPVVFSFDMQVLRPENGVMMKFVQFDVVENEEENDGSTMVKDTENLNLLDEAEMYKVSGDSDEEIVIGATEY